MPRPVQKDSMSRSETPSMLYDAVRNPNAPRTLPKHGLDSSSNGKDTIETTQQRLNREMLERFQNTSSRVPHNFFVVVVQAGKYLFMAVMLPPYIFFYGIPRWFLMDALPQLFSFAKTETLRVGRFFSEKSKQLIDVMKGLVDQTIGDALRMMQHGFKKGFQLIYGSIEGVKSRLSKVAKSVSRQAVALNFRLQHAKRQMHASAEKVLSHIKKLAKKGTAALESTLRSALHPLDLADRLLFKPVVHWIKNRVKAASHQTSRVISERSDAVSKWMKKMMNPLISQIRGAIVSTFQPLQQAVIRTGQLITERLEPSFELLKSSLELFRDGIVRTFEKTRAFVRKKMEEVSSTVIEQVKQSVQFPVNLVVQVVGWAWWQLSEPLKKQWGFIREKGAGSRRAYRFIAGVIIAGAKGLGRNGQRLARQVFYRLIRGLALVLKLLKKGTIWAISQLIALPRKIFWAAGWFLKALLKTARSIIFALRIFFAWVFVISGFGMNLVRELSHEISSWFLLIKREDINELNSKDQS